MNAVYIVTLQSLYTIETDERGAYCDFTVAVHRRDRWMRCILWLYCHCTLSRQRNAVHHLCHVTRQWLFLTLDRLSIWLSVTWLHGTTVYTPTDISIILRIISPRCFSYSLVACDRHHDAIHTKRLMYNSLNIGGHWIKKIVFKLDLA